MYIYICKRYWMKKLHSASILLRASCSTHSSGIHRTVWKSFIWIPDECVEHETLISILAEYNFFMHYGLFVSSANWALWIVGNRTTIVYIYFVTLENNRESIVKFVSTFSVTILPYYYFKVFNLRSIAPNGCC